ncbi:pilus assembly protein PilM [bacterium]|nr:pilus assembly protein PilM [bacterium]
MGVFSKECLGIDIGVSSIKVVEVSRLFKKNKLLNYADFQLPVGISSTGVLWDKDFSLLSNNVSSILKNLLKRAKIKTGKVFFSLPDFSTFFTTFDLPPMPPSKIPQAVSFEAKHHIPVALSEVDFDWQVVKGIERASAKRKTKILLVAVPKKIIYQYQKLSMLANLKLQGLEAEVFSLARVSASLSEVPFCLVDMGVQTTTVNIVAKEVLESHSFDISSRTLTESLAKGLGVSISQAEEIKRKYSFNREREDVFKIISGCLNSLCKEIDSICERFYQTYGKTINDVKIAGGMALLPGLPEYMQNFLKKNVLVINPFSIVSYPPLLKPRLKELGPSLAIALGTAIRGVSEQ